jgi:hypothetical protein
VRRQEYAQRHSHARNLTRGTDEPGFPGHTKPCQSPYGVDADDRSRS